MFVKTRGEDVPETRALDEMTLIGAMAFAQHGGGTRALGVASVSVALAVVVRMAQRLPKGSPERRALAEAARPLRASLPD